MTQVFDPLPAGPTNEAQIAQFESLIGNRLPDGYRSFLLQYNGGHPAPAAFVFESDLGEEEDVVMCFFPMSDASLGDVAVEELEQLRTWPLHCAWADLQNDLVNLYRKQLPEKLLPIGTDGSGNYVCIVLDGNRRESILFFEHEMAETTILATSFTRFLESLRQSAQPDAAVETRRKAMEKAVQQADEKFRKKDFKAVVSLLSPHENELGQAAAAKLKIAKKKLT